MKEPLVSRILRYSLYLIFCLGLCIILTLPMLLDIYSLYLYDSYSLHQGYRTFILAFLVLIGCLGLWVIADLIFMLRTISTDPFLQRNVRALKRIGAIALVIALLFFFKCLWYITFLTIVCGIVFLFCSLVIFTVGMLFARAVQYKEENELTI